MFGAIVNPLLGQAGGGEKQRVSNNRIYKEERDLFKTTPNAFLVEVLKGRRAGRALDIAMGQGRNAVWLAEQGWQVTGFDISDVALREAQDEAARRKIRLTTILSGYEQFDFGKEKWDLIVLSYFFPRDLVPKLFESLRPGGLIMLEYYHKDSQRIRMIDGTSLPELMSLFAPYRFVRYEEATGSHDWGLTLGRDQRIVRLLAQRPEPAPVGCVWSEKPFAVGATACWTERNFLMRCDVDGWRYSKTCNPER